MRTLGIFIRESIRKRDDRRQARLRGEQARVRDDGRVERDGEGHVALGASDGDGAGEEDALARGDARETFERLSIERRLDGTVERDDKRIVSSHRVWIVFRGDDENINDGFRRERRRCPRAG